MYVESWAVLVSFVVFLVFFIVMSFVSRYYKDWQAGGLGRWINFAWMVVVIIIFGILLTINVGCTITGNCRYMSIIVAVFVVGLTLFNMGLGIYKTVKYNEEIETE